MPPHLAGDHRSPSRGQRLPVAQPEYLAFKDLFDIAALDRLLTIETRRNTMLTNGFRAVVPAGEWIDDCTPAVRRLFDSAIDALRNNGITVDVAAIPSLDQAQRLMDRCGTIVGAEAYAAYGHLLSTPAAIEPATRRRLARNAGVRPDAVQHSIPTLRLRAKRCRSAVPRCFLDELDFGGGRVWCRCGQVGLHGSGSNEKRCGDVRVGEFFTYESHDLGLDRVSDARSFAAISRRAIAVRPLPVHFLDQPCHGIVEVQRDVSPLLRRFTISQQPCWEAGFCSNLHWVTPRTALAWFYANSADHQVSLGAQFFTCDRDGIQRPGRDSER
jgi:hypothetical protein